MSETCGMHRDNLNCNNSSARKEFSAMDKCGLQGVFIALFFLLVSPMTAFATSLFGCGNITTSGNYVLQQDIEQSAAEDCFIITGSRVTLNLNSHHIVGFGAFFGASAVVSRGASSIVIKNGFIEEFGCGITAESSSAVNIQNNELRKNLVGLC